MEFKGKEKIREKREWKRWIKKKEMIERDKENYGRLKKGMDGGKGNKIG